MELEPYVDKLREQLAVAASAGGEDALLLAQRLTAALESAVRLTLLDALSVAAAEITSDLAPGSVELRLRGGEPEFVVTGPLVETTGERTDTPQPTGGWSSSAAAGASASESGEGATARINLRLPDQLKSRVEQSADREGLSINAWLVRAVAAAVDRGQPGPPREQRSPRSGQRYTGWGR
jgi:hypothetical protein